MARFLLLATLLAVLVGMSTAQTFCEKYSGSTTNATFQTNLITAVVVRAVTGGIYTSPSNQTVQVNGLFNASGPLYNIFAGITQYRTNPPNYTNDTTALGTLAGKLVAYFGALFGCNAPGYPQPAVTNMYAVHRNMNITNTQEIYFNTALANTLVSFGVVTADLTTAGTALSWFNRCGAPLGGNLGNGTAGLLQICGAADCPIAGNANYSTCVAFYGAATSSSSSTGTAVTPTSIYPTGSFLVPLTVNIPSNLSAAQAVPLIRQDIAYNIATESGITNAASVVPYVLIQSFNNTALAPASRRLLQTSSTPVTFILLGNITQLGGNAANTATVVNNFKAAAAAGTLVAPNSGGSIPVQTVTPVVPGAYSSSSSAGAYTSSTGNGATGKYAGGLIVAVASVLASLLL